MVTILLIAMSQIGSPPPDATPSVRGLVSTGVQRFGGRKIFDGGIVADIAAGSSLQGVPLCGTAPTVGQSLVYTGLTWCPATVGVMDAGPAPDAGVDAGMDAGIDAGMDAGYMYAFLEFAPSTGVGMGTQCSCTPVSAVLEDGGTVSVSVSRSTSAECYSNDGQTLTTCGANTPRVASWRTDSTWLALMAERSADNVVTYRRDLSNAAWTKTSMTCARTATGMHSDANGASTCTASGSNGTVTFTATASAATRTGSFHIKRRAGTGTISVSRDLATWTAITSSVDSSWKRVVSSPTWGCAPTLCISVSSMTSTTANPSIGIRLGTSGDAVDVDFVQDEAGAVATTPFDASSRSSDQISLTATLPVVRSISMHYMQSIAASSAATFMWDSTLTDYYWWSMSPSYNENVEACSYRHSGIVTSGGNLTPVPRSYGDYVGVACEFGPTSISAVVNNITQTTSVTDSAPSPMATAYLGNSYTAAYGLGGPIRAVCISSVSGACTSASRMRLDKRTTAWVGDSISWGSLSPDYKPPDVLGYSLMATVQNMGVAGSRIDSCASRAESTLYSTEQYSRLIWLCGVNSVIDGVSAATIWSATQPVLDHALDAGLDVRPVTLTPWHGSTYWTSGVQTVTETLNTYIRNYCTAKSISCVDAYAGLGDTDPTYLRAACSADGLHPNAAGSRQLACLVRASIQGFSPSLCVEC